MAKLTYFDCNCSIGRVPYPQLLDNHDVSGLLKEMDTAGIEEALVYHSAARDIDPAYGNALLDETLEGQKRLHPVWVVMPHHTGEMPTPKLLIREMERKGVKAVRMFPAKDFHSFSLAGWSSGELLSALEEARVPLMLDIEIVWWEAVQSILAAHPKLPVIATNVSYRHDRFTYPLFEKYDTLYVEMSRWFGSGALEAVVERFGPRPILVGTNMPRFTGTAVISMLTYADISIEAKEAVAGGNLRKLMKEALS